MNISPKIIIINDFSTVDGCKKRWWLTWLTGGLERLFHAFGMSTTASGIEVSIARNHIGPKSALQLVRVALFGTDLVESSCSAKNFHSMM